MREKLIDLQMKGAGDEEIQAEQEKLNQLYDKFQEKYGVLNSTGNRLAFRQDSSYPLLCSLEVIDEEGNLKRKADMFSKRTNTAQEAGNKRGHGSGGAGGYPLGNVPVWILASWPP